MALDVERPYTIQEVCKLTGLSPRTITKLFEAEKGVIVYQDSPSRLRAGNAAAFGAITENLLVSHRVGHAFGTN
jgi:hypothetical protein